MILTKVTLQDYGVYRGKNEFDFTCESSRPIVLIGGQNGAGKTTLFDSIMLCLYGISAIGKRTTKKEYEKYLARKMHRYSKGSAHTDHASIVVQFSFFHNNKEAEYRVERLWRIEDGRMHEQLGISKRDSNQEKFHPLDTVESSHWQSFIEGLLPKGIVKLFFFDGEKIVKIAREGIEDLVIRDSFKSLLGIEVVEQLRADLQVNLTRSISKKSKSLQQDFGKYKKEKDECVSLTARLQDRLAQKQTAMDSLSMEIENLETSISKIGGGFASSRDDAKAKLAAKTAIHDSLKQRLTELCSGVLPFAMVPDDLDRLSDQLKADRDIENQEMGQKLLNSTFKAIRSRLRQQRLWTDAGFDASDAKKAASLAISVLDEKKDTGPAEEPLFGLSAMQTSHILGIIRQANTASLDSLRKHTAEIIRVKEDMARLESSIANAPDDDELGTLVSKIRELHTSEGALRSEMDHIEEKISSNASLRNHLDAKLHDIVSQIYKNEKSLHNVEMTQNVQKVLDEFIKRLRSKKIQLLEQYLMDAIAVLLHKKNLIEKARVDKDTFEVSLFGKDGSRFPKDDLSEGEKQMFATAVLWALAKTSDRTLPFVIDTPLARLDAGHRKNMVEEFLPAVSHQVLILSTDTEIDADDYQKLKPSLTRSYAMEYLGDEGFTKLHETYFWNREGRRIVAVQ